jgi:2-oxoglutarate dehydrogenase E1 component
VDVICYRRHGHNEVDQPVYTQPVMYSKIALHPDTLKVYENALLKEGVCDQSHFDKTHALINKTFEADWEAAKTWVSPKYDWLGSKWAGFLSPHQLSRIRPTGCSIDVLKRIGKSITTIPASANPNSQIQKIYQQRYATIESGEGLDWATAESLAFGTLLTEGNHVRLSGQDVQRGTFSHRHAVIRNQATGAGYCPLNHIAPNVVPSLPLDRSIDKNSQSCSVDKDQQAEITVQNSILSEFGVLGFENGYSLENPNMLVLWEAQFGDFVNGAQIMIDQFISAGEDKWLRQSGLTMLLPHGYMGQGAEHSSCRIERFLQQCDEDSDVIPNMDGDIRTQIQLHNWQVVNCTTPANYFHVLRRQIHREFRKPLIIATPKNLLRDKVCTSSLADMAEGTRFKRVIGEVDEKISSQGSKVERLLYCSGKVYYELADARKKLGLSNVAIVRVEQLAPFPWDHVAQEAARYPNAAVVWCQEEPKNMGGWSYTEPRIATALRKINDTPNRRATYVGRNPSAATATGLGSRAHNAEQQKVLAEALGVTVADLRKAFGPK